MNISEILITLLVTLTVGFLLVGSVRADTINPCEYLNLANDANSKLDIGPDDESANFRRRYQDNNREMILACQEYQIKRMKMDKQHIDRENF